VEDYQTPDVFSFSALNEANLRKAGSTRAWVLEMIQKLGNKRDAAPFQGFHFSFLRLGHILGHTTRMSPPPILP
jgi:hypothetical protein